MKLAECLLQEKPIRHESHRDKGIWFDPKIKKYGYKLHLSSNDIYNLHALSAEDFACDGWEIKTEPLKHEFESDISESIGAGYLCFTAVPLSFIGKKVKVTVEEIFE